MILSPCYNMMSLSAITILLKLFGIMVPIQIWSSMIHFLHFMHLFIPNPSNAWSSY
ncbi:hypothetical protein MKX03_031376 [Papaver bracteatum]|nr:hypothetical protein MKX03_031376 [Papaver bracteatum]